MTNDPIGGTGPLFTVGLGVGAQGPIYYGGTYKYVLLNRKHGMFCNPDRIESIIPFPGVIGKVGAPSSDPDVLCVHTPPAVPEAGDGGGECDPTEWCCCMWETAQNYYTCLSRGLWPSDFCPMSGVSAPAYTTNGSTNGTSIGSENTPTRLGVFRNNGTPGGSLITDPAGLGSYDPAVSQELTTFVPPGGIQSTDKIVSGDWAGRGVASIGVYRPSTGMWYLDWNGNGIWDPGANGDVQYQFGGVQPTGTPGQPGYVPGDVPVVGSWYGAGQDCIGVFRWGHTWVIDLNCNGTWDGTRFDAQFEFGGAPGDVPIVGRWNNKVATTVGVVRCYVAPGSSQCSSPPFYWILDHAATYESQYVHGVADGPLGCGVPLYVQAFGVNSDCAIPAPFAFGGLPGDVFFVGDWNAEGRIRPGVYRGGQWVLSLDDDMSTVSYWFGGLAIDSPLPGKW